MPNLYDFLYEGDKKLFSSSLCYPIVIVFISYYHYKRLFLWNCDLLNVYLLCHVNKFTTTATTTTTTNNNNNNNNNNNTAPFVIETSGTWNAQAIELTEEIGRRTTAVTGDPLEIIHLFQFAIQLANAFLRARSNLSESHIQP